MTRRGTLGLVLVLGGSSDIGLTIARRCAAEGGNIALVGRSPEAMQADAQDLRIRFSVDVSVHALDVLDAERHAAFLDGLGELPDVVICVVGLMLPQEVVSAPAEARRVMETNYVAPALLLGAVADRMQRRRSGTIVGVSSVAGDRGRASNYIYGSAKAGFTAFLSGLRARLSGTGVHVVTVKPGYVATRMTEGMALPARLTAQPDEVGAAVVAAIRHGRDVIYVRRVWRLIMLAIALLPERLFKRLTF